MGRTFQCGVKSNNGRPKFWGLSGNVAFWGSLVDSGAQMRSTTATIHSKSADGYRFIGEFSEGVVNSLLHKSPGAATEDANELLRLADGIDSVVGETGKSMVARRFAELALQAADALSLPTKTLHIALPPDWTPEVSNDPAVFSYSW
jgi:hypothetical protein